MIHKLPRRHLLGLLFAAASIGPLARILPSKAQNLVTFPKSKLTIATAKGAHKFNIEMAVSRDQQAQGLMFRKSLPADAGMLFDYKRRQRITMWMKNTFIPLDMLFIAADGRIVNIYERAIPRSHSTISSKGKVLAVLEINGGTVSRLGIKPGDQVSHPIFER